MSAAKIEDPRDTAWAVLRDLPGKRRPRLLRSRQEDYLFATDVPLFHGEEVIREKVVEYQALGWTVDMSGGWLLLKSLWRRPEVPEFDPGDAVFLTETQSLMQLLARHPLGEADMRLNHTLYRALDEGKEALEAWSLDTHISLAERLRTGEALPDLLPWVQGACLILKKRQQTASNMRKEVCL
ncbi:MAG: hypothetical protein IJ083_07420 [Clostridia bacterium]|nr:hypothetical protein [Clostridia bacterium]